MLREARQILIVAAHPDDETIGAAAQLALWGSRVTILHATNGSPGNNAEYALTRRCEVLNAVRLAGIRRDQCHEIGLVDQQASFHLAELTRAIHGWLRAFQPDVVLTHPYEGGHPDHDSCAFAANAAAGLSGIGEVWEWTSYHMGPGGSAKTGEFLGGADGAEIWRLSAAEQQMKHAMFEAFASQRDVLAWFRTDTEAFRPAPLYDFSEPPHRGQLFYEQFAWGVTGRRWRELAADAASSLGIEVHVTHGA